MEKLLSVAIPTYNRCECLREELECIIPQLLPYKDSVEIVISDNASPESDGTASMVVELEKKYGISIDYKKIENPIYFEDNFKEVVSRTHGKYIHMTGDDDIFSPAFYDYIFKIIAQEDNIGLLYFNYLRGDGKCSNGKIKEPLYETNQFVGTTKEFIGRVMENPGFMSALVYRRDCWDKGERFEKEEYYGYHFLGRVYQGALSLKTNACYCYVPMVIQRNPPKRTWSNSFPLFYFVGYSNIFKDLDSLIPGIYDKWLNKLHNIRRIRRNINDMRGITRQNYASRKREFWPHLCGLQRVTFSFMISVFAVSPITNIYFFIIRVYYIILKAFHL